MYYNSDGSRRVYPGEDCNQTIEDSYELPPSQTDIEE